MGYIENLKIILPKGWKNRIKNPDVELSGKYGRSNVRIKIMVLMIVSFSYMTLYGQSYSTRMIINKADSILKQNVSDHVYQYFKFDSESYYIYSGVFKNRKIFKNYTGALNSWGVKRLIRNKTTKGNFTKTDVRFFLSTPRYKGNPWYDLY